MLNFGASKPRVKGAPPGSAPGHTTKYTIIVINYHCKSYYKM